MNDHEAAAVASNLAVRKEYGRDYLRTYHGILFMTALMAASLPVRMVFAEDATIVRYDNNITVNPTSILLIGPGEIGYTRAVGELLSITLSCLWRPPLDSQMLGGGVDFLLWPRRPNTGFFIGPSIQLVKVWTNTYVGGVALIPGLVTGWRWLWGDGLNIAIGGGGGARIWLSRARQDPAWIDYSSFAFRLVLDVGYAF